MSRTHKVATWVNYWDRGLLGIAVHPDFPNTPYVYLLYTYDPPGTTDNGGGARVARLLRVTADPANTNVAIPGSGVVILGTNSTFANIGNPNNNGGAPSCQSGASFIQDCIAADSPSHTIGTLAFGTDGSLFVSSGDGAHFSYTDARALRSLDIDSLNGKILRINPITGEGYTNNPFYNGNANGNRSKVYSLGLRNPFRVTINTLTNEPFIGDVGWNLWEEINTGRGENFGWPCYEGNNTTSAMQNSYRFNASTSATCAALYAQGLGAVEAPLYAYNHSSGSSSVQAGAFYRGSVYPSQYQGALFISDYNADWIRYLTFDAGGNATVNNFATDAAPVGGIVQLLAGPDTNLYYVAYNGPTPDTSEVRRIRYTAGANTPPTANASADPTSGYVPLDVDFSSQGTFDPDAQTLIYLWDFDDGNTSADPNPTHTYLASGTFTVTLTVTDPAGASGTDTVTITVGNLAPVATILAPVNGFPYDTNDTINYSGTGVDNEDGNLSGASLQWDILLHHNSHTHFDYIPGLIDTTGTFDVPDHGDNSWIELCLTVTDSGGLNDQECVNLTPNTVTFTFDTVPTGLQLEYDGVTYTTPFNVVTNVAAVRDLIAAPVQGCHNFVSWSDGGAASHQITIPSTPTTYIATYAPCPITITANPGQSKTYGNADPVFSYTSSQPGVPLTGALSRAAGENVGNYAITQGTLASADSRYAITSFIGANFAVNPRNASVTPNAAGKIYVNAEPLITGTLTGFLAADNVTASYSRAPGETVAGSPYLISATLSPSGVLSNYNITYNTANFTISQRTASVTPNPAGKIYGNGDPSFTGTLSGFLPADNVTVVYNRVAGETVTGSPYPISAVLSPLGVLGNYNVTYNTADFTINAASASVLLSNLSRTYDGTPKSADATKTPNGLSVSITYDGSPTSPTDAGSYAVAATITDPNYAGAANDTLSISSATVDPLITADNKVYDGTTAATIATRNLTDVLGADDVSLTGGTATFADPDVGTWTVTATGLSLSGTDAGNYQLSSTTATTTASITPAGATVDTEIHSAGHTAITSAAIGSSVHAGAIVTGNGATPTGTVTFTVFNNNSCSGTGSGAGTVALDAGAAADPSNASIVTASGVSFRAAYNGDANYSPQTGACVSLSVAPAFTSADNTTFTVGSVGAFNVTTAGLPDVSSITQTGSLPTGVTFTDNGDGTASLTGIPAAGTNSVYPLVFTATNGIVPDAVQSFTLSVEQAAPPIVSPTAGINTVSPTSDNILTEFEIVRVNVTQFTVTFDQDVLDVDEDDPDFGDSVINPANYMLVRDNGNGFETVSCEDGITGDDTQISIDAVTYDNNDGAGPFVATLSVNLGLPLSNGTYRLYVCGTTSIINVFGVPLAGNGAAGTDFVRNFLVDLSTGGNSGGNNQGSGGNNNVTVLNSLLIPVTGFAPGEVTRLPQQPEELAYAPTGGLRLEIPSLGVNVSIVGVKQTKSGWDLTWLGNNAGYLEGSAYPTWHGNTVLTAHVLDSRNVPGPFANIKQLKDGELIYIHAEGLTYIYQIQSSEVVLPGDNDAVFEHKDYDWLTLVTCENFYKPTKTYLSRRVVHAALISVIVK